MLLSQGLQLVANAALAKGKAYIRDKTGVDLEQAQLSEADLVKLKQFEAEHEEELLKLRLEDDKLSLAETKLFLADTQDARDREVRIATSEIAPWYSKAVTPFLAVLTVLLTFAAFGNMVFLSDRPSPTAHELAQSISGIQYLMKSQTDAALLKEAVRVVEAGERVLAVERERKNTQKEIMLYILGVLSAIATQIYAYYFGSSRGSARKDETIASLSGPKGGKS